MGKECIVENIVFTHVTCMMSSPFFLGQLQLLAEMMQQSQSVMSGDKFPKVLDILQEWGGIQLKNCLRSYW